EAASGGEHRGLAVARHGAREAVADHEAARLRRADALRGVLATERVVSDVDASRQDGAQALVGRRLAALDRHAAERAHQLVEALARGAVHRHAGDAPELEQRLADAAVRA